MAKFDPVQAGREINAHAKLMEKSEKKTADHRDTLQVLLKEANAKVPDFDAFLEKYTTMARSTAYRLLAIADGRGDEVREQENARQQKHRAAESVTTLVTDTKAVPRYRVQQLHDEPRFPLFGRSGAAALR
jgi:hypothetical protein